MNMNMFSHKLCSRFARETRGSVSIETLIMFPLLLWAMVSTVVFFDGFRSRNQTQVAAQTVADLLSRSTNAFTADYLEGMNDVFDFLADSRYPTRLRISSVIWNSAAERNALQWSYGTRGFSPLPTETFDYLAENDMTGLIARFGEIEGFNFTAAAAQAPAPELVQRIPPVLPGEALILVESFAMWSPFANVGVGQIRFNPIVVTRPRFSPWINLDGVTEIFPEGDYEVTFAGYVPSLPEPVPEPEPEPQATAVIVAQDFDAGVTTGWSQTPTTNTTRPGIGTFLGPFGNATWDNPVTRAIDLGPGDLASARIEFDLLIIDSWDGFDTTWAAVEGDVFSLMVNGTAISLDAFKWVGNAKDNNRITRTYLAGSYYTVSMTRTLSGVNFVGSSDWHDQIWRVTVDVQAPPRLMTLGFRARLNESIQNESFGLDNFTVSRTLGTPTPVAFTPNASNLLGLDPHTRFPVYSGCPNVNLPANWLTVTNQNLSTSVPIGMTRRARGATLINGTNCPGISGQFRHVHASPTLIFNYDNQGQSGTGRQLRMQTNDGTSGGSACDATLLVRDPTGQWWFNSEISLGSWHTPANYNARINFANAPSGTYHVWVGHYASASCDTRIEFLRY